jgi:hypothetical protein
MRGDKDWTASEKADQGCSLGGDMGKQETHPISHNGCPTASCLRHEMEEPVKYSRPERLMRGLFAR